MSVVEQARERLGRVGVWLALTTLGAAPVDARRQAASRIEALGFGSLWSSEAIGRNEVMAQQAVLLAATERLVLGTGIANLWARHGAAMQAGAATLAEAYPGRFVLGVGVSYLEAVERSGQTYGQPVQRMREYLDQMDAASSGGPNESFPRVLAALRPRMLGLARDRADGVHTFLAPVEHTKRAREILGPDKLVPHQAMVLETDPAKARGIARSNFPLGMVPTSPYVKNLRSLGYGDEDFADGLSDRLVDAVVAWGDETAIARRIQHHVEAGADHVVVHPLTRDSALLQPNADDLPTTVDHLERLAQ